MKIDFPANWQAFETPELKMRLQSIRTLQQRISQTGLAGLGIFLTMSLGLAAAGLMVHNNLRFAERALIYVSTEPLFIPIWVHLFLIANYLSIVSAIYIARERDRGTYEVLCCGPVDESSFLLGVFIAQVKIYLFALVVVFVWANIVTWLLHLAYHFRLLILLVQSVFMATSMISLGILTAVWGNRTRTTIFYYIFAILLLAGVLVGDQIMRSLLASGQSVNESILLLSKVLRVLAMGLEWISPPGQMMEGINALAVNDFVQGGLHTLAMIVQTGVLLTGSIWILQAKKNRL